MFSQWRFECFLSVWQGFCLYMYESKTVSIHLYSMIPTVPWKLVLTGWKSKGPGWVWENRGEVDPHKRSERKEVRDWACRWCWLLGSVWVVTVLGGGKYQYYLVTAKFVCFKSDEHQVTCSKRIKGNPGKRNSPSHCHPSSSVPMGILLNTWCLFKPPICSSCRLYLDFHLW